MIPVLIAIGVLAFVWLGAQFKTSRKDGTLLKVHPYRRMLWVIMKRRDESVVYFESEVRAEPLLAWLAAVKPHFEVDVTHALVGAIMIGLAENPEMNRFTVGQRLYQRKDRIVTFSMKRKRLDKKAKLSTVKIDMRDGETFRQFVERLNSSINVERSGKKTYTDKEFDLFTALPPVVLDVAHSAMRWLEIHNMLPYSFTEKDAMYTSVFLANLGSLKMDAGRHHLFEWGTCPLFLMAGQIADKPVVENGEVKVGKVMKVTFSYDERIDDGLTARHGIDTMLRVLRAPEQYLGKLLGDEGEDRPMWPRAQGTYEELVATVGQEEADKVHA